MIANFSYCVRPRDSFSRHWSCSSYRLPVICLYPLIHSKTVEFGCNFSYRTPITLNIIHAYTLIKERYTGTFPALPDNAHCTAYVTSHHHSTTLSITIPLGRYVTQDVGDGIKVLISDSSASVIREFMVKLEKRIGRFCDRYDGTLKFIPAAMQPQHHHSRNSKCLRYLVTLITYFIELISWQLLLQTGMCYFSS